MIIVISTALLMVNDNAYCKPPAKSDTNNLSSLIESREHYDLQMESSWTRKELSDSAFNSSFSLEAPVLSSNKREFFVIEGDILVSKSELSRLATSSTLYNEWKHVAPNIPYDEWRTITDKASLKGLENSKGEKVAWTVGLELTYSVVRLSFRSDSEYHQVVKHFASAAGEWQQACNVRFRHLNHLDDLTPSAARANGALFVVGGSSRPSDFVAVAFFPYAASNRREVVVFDTYFSSGLKYDRTGVFRHEIGHILGFPHEHIGQFRLGPCARIEKFLKGLKPADLTAYDSTSCMHYPCGRSNFTTFAITSKDIEGAQRLYPF